MKIGKAEKRKQEQETKKEKLVNLFYVSREHPTHIHRAIFDILLIDLQNTLLFVSYAGYQAVTQDIFK